MAKTKDRGSPVSPRPSRHFPRSYKQQSHRAQAGKFTYPTVRFFQTTPVEAIANVIQFTIEKMNEPDSVYIDAFQI